VTAGVIPPHWPDGVWPVDVDGWIDSAVAWLFDAVGIAEWREVEVLRRHPVVLARLVAEHVEADLAAARLAWGHVGDLVVGAAPEADRESGADAVRGMLARAGPQLAARARAARLLEQALTGQRWVPRL
jgi:hypothetical protein